MHIRIGTRRSELARIQASLVGSALCGLGEGITVEYVLKNAEGDRDKTTPLWQLPDKGVFTRDLSDLLISGAIDIAVHSWKDLPLLEDSVTSVVATLPRADMRDLLMLRKDRWKRVSETGVVKTLSSSPRRAYNLKDFLPWALPARIREISFESVRGNVQTRMQKLLDSDADGMVVAKAALDRILSCVEPEYQQVAEELRKALAQCYWMITPLSANPCAAAQGALAIETLRKRDDLRSLLSQINCAETFSAVQEERRVLRQYGGGCHQKIGVAVLQRPYGRISFLRGMTDSGEILREIKLEKVGVKPPRVGKEQIWPLQMSEATLLESRVLKDVIRPQNGVALWVAKAVALPVEWKVSFDTICWAAGTETWRKLAERGIWVHGCADSLGENESHALDPLLPLGTKWVKLSHREAPFSEELPLCATYELFPVSNMPDLKAKSHFFWRSASAFSAALKVYPQIASCWHACGPGNTFRGIKQILGNSEKLTVYLDHQQWLDDVLEN